MKKNKGESTKKEYTKILNRYEHLDATKPNNVFKYLKNVRSMKMNVKKEDRKPEPLSDSYIRMALCAFKYKITQTTPVDKLLLEKYTELINKIQHKIQHKIQTKKQHTNKFPKINMENIRVTLNDPKIKYDVGTLIKALYTLNPPRRLNDYAYMKYVDTMDEANDIKFNYYIQKKKIFLFQNYKTHSTYGRQTIKIPMKLHNIIKNYIETNNIQKDHALLKYTIKSNKDTYSKANLSRYLMKIFGTSVDGIRHAYITQIYKDPANIYNITELSRQMAHNVETHLHYLDKDNKIV